MIRFNIFQKKRIFAMYELNIKQQTIVLLIIILSLLNKTNIKKNGMNQEGGMTKRAQNTHELQIKHDEQQFFKRLNAVSGWNPFNWGLFPSTIVVMAFVFVGSIASSILSEDDKVGRKE